MSVTLILQIVLGNDWKKYDQAKYAYKPGIQLSNQGLCLCHDPRVQAFARPNCTVLESLVLSYLAISIRQLHSLLQKDTINKLQTRT
jgi:hypothetical protein